ncbi:2-amino-4-hydroxy-6-hydroxymethyldihydropteridine diphosphokinase [Acidithiobacillus caldus]|uniref:2-amino-4-hydroxy-6- hydroxymethyldihydropteridine diphosphokinase n=1 Tax=Acidithiobacillus caldus TaxID=33059 RepID=UPI001D022C19|nr:2-amino-4-hydroxy-6-hydroxymethyldihydropteridine diphosphokinase [Acidithiobacillus caldus]
MPVTSTEPSTNFRRLETGAGQSLGRHRPPENAAIPSVSRRAVLAFVALGSNLEDPMGQVERALGALAQLPGSRLIWQSSLYLSAPVGGVVQPPFINAVAALWTRLGAAELLASLHELEQRAGRQRAEERYWGPRILDLDLLSHGSCRVTRADLVLPHPRLHERAFVLLPLSEFDPEWHIPGQGPLSQFLAAVADQPIQRLAPGKNRNLQSLQYSSFWGKEE